MNANWAPHFTPIDFSNTPSDDEPSNWAHPVYWATATDPTYMIAASCASPPVAISCPTSVRIPAGARPALAGDGHLAVIEADGTEVDFWQASISGSTISASLYGGLSIDGDGCCGNATAANEGLPAGEIRAQEMATGVIQHALAVAEECSNGQFVPPATGAGAGGCADAPPVGARLQLKMTDAQIAASNDPVWEKIILHAMADFGMYVTDTGGGPMDIEFEPALQYTSMGDTSHTMMTWLQSQGFTDPAELTISLPWSDFQIVSTCYSMGRC